MYRIEQARLFRLYVILKAGGASLLNDMIEEANEMTSQYPEATWLSRVLPGEITIGIQRPELS